MLPRRVGCALLALLQWERRSRCLQQLPGLGEDIVQLVPELLQQLEIKPSTRLMKGTRLNFDDLGSEVTKNKDVSMKLFLTIATLQDSDSDETTM